MPLIGNPYIIGDTASNFKLLDDISSYTWTFDATSGAVVSLTNETLTLNAHRFITGQRVTYTNGGGTSIGGLTSGTAYYAVKSDQNTIKLALTYADALASNTINLTSLGVGSSHTLRIAFDGINTKFKATYNSGTRAAISNAAQLTISINGVIQRPYQTATPTDGYGIEDGNTIVFSSAPVSSDAFWGNIIANSFPTYDISDNKVDTFTANGVDTDFTLSQIPPNNESVLVTIDGVTQYPSDNTTSRSYSIYGSVLSFTEPPSSGLVIQARHIGFSGATSSSVTGFNGRTGNVGLRTGDPLVGVGIQSASYVVGSGVTVINFVGAGNTFYDRGNGIVDISISGSGGGNSVIRKESYTVTSATQSLFTLVDPYTTGYLDVFVNGVRLSTTDFTETSTTSVTLINPAVGGDIVDFVSVTTIGQNTTISSEVTNLRVTGIATITNANLISATISSGIVSATKYYGDGSGLSNIEGANPVATSGFLSNVFYVNTVGTVTENSTVSSPSVSDAPITYTKYQDVVVNSNIDLTVADGNDFLINVYQLP